MQYIKKEFIKFSNEELQSIEKTTSLMENIFRTSEDVWLVDIASRIYQDLIELQNGCREARK